MRLEQINLFLTLRCNLDCSFCSAGSHPGRHEEMEFSLLERIADQISKIFSFNSGGSPLIRFTGGEPVLYSHFDAALQLFSFAPEVSITTNSLAINARRLKSIKDAKNARVITSAYSDSTFTNFINERQIRNIIDSSIPTTITMIADKRNLTRIEDMILILSQWGATHIAVNGLMPGNKNPKSDRNFTLNYNEVQHLEGIIKRLAVGEIRIDYSPISYSSTDGTQATNIVPHCRCGEGHISIGYDGTAFPCNSLINFPVGSIHEHDILTLYRSERMQFIRATLGLKKSDFEPCNKCELAAGCAVGSRVVSFLLDRDWMRVDSSAPCAENTQFLEFADTNLQDLYEKTNSCFPVLRSPKVL